jgi:choline dehydrogenase-like flavoprotein
MNRRRNPVPDPLQSSWAHAALHFTSAGSGTHSDMMLIQSSIPITKCIVHGVSLIGQWKMLCSTAGKMSLPKLVDYVRNGWDHAITCIMQQDSSRGEIRLTSADPNENPAMHYHYLDTETDRRRLRDAFRLAVKLVDSKQYRELGVRRTDPNDDVLGSDAALDKFLIDRLGTSMHMASTCRMGPTAESAVVDQYCRVRDIDQLRVVDSSIMPTVVRRCPAATAVMIGERAAAFFG